MNLEKHNDTVRADAVDDKNSCVPIAIASVYGLPFDHINDKMIAQGVRRKHKGSMNFEWSQFCRREFSQSFTDVTEQVLDAGGLSCRSIESVCTSGKFLVCVRNHALALVDGKILDWSKGRTHIIKTVFAVGDEYTITPRENWTPLAREEETFYLRVQEIIGELTTWEGPYKWTSVGTSNRKGRIKLTNAETHNNISITKRKKGIKVVIRRENFFSSKRPYGEWSEVFELGHFLNKLEVTKFNTPKHNVNFVTTKNIKTIIAAFIEAADYGKYVG
jgi:hypothetical protein